MLSTDLLFDEKSGKTTSKRWKSLPVNLISPEMHQSDCNVKSHDWFNFVRSGLAVILLQNRFRIYNPCRGWRKFHCLPSVPLFALLLVPDRIDSSCTPRFSKLDTQIESPARYNKVNDTLLFSTWGWTQGKDMRVQQIGCSVKKREAAWTRLKGVYCCWNEVNSQKHDNLSVIWNHLLK